MHEVAVTVVGGPTVVLEWAGLRILTDPTFDPPQTYPAAPGSVPLTKTRGPAITAEEVGEFDAALLSHHVHRDNLDLAGSGLLASLPVIVSTEAAAAEWAALPIAAPGERGTVGIGAATVTVVPAQHRPDGIAPVPGGVIGFVLTAPGEPTVYVSGDNQSLAVVRRIAREHGPVDLAVLHAGAARVATVDGPLTLTSADAVEAARILGASAVAGVHLEDWAHFTEGPGPFRSAFAAAGLEHLLVDAARGTRTSVAFD